MGRKKKTEACKERKGQTGINSKEKPIPDKIVDKSISYGIYKICMR